MARLYEFESTKELELEVCGQPVKFVPDGKIFWFGTNDDKLAFEIMDGIGRNELPTVIVSRAVGYTRKARPEEFSIEKYNAIHSEGC